METFLVILVLLAIIGVSNVINHLIPFIPVPLIQIALGALVAVSPSGIHISLHPELFFVLFVAPLLFNDGKRIPREELWHLRAPILLLALGLVFATVFIAGYVIYWLVPSIPLPAAFALAAILSPTDAVAVTSLTGRVHLPKRILHLLEGEALMNDASGLVAFKFAIAATVTGVFSLAQATFSFFVIAVGGLFAGALMAFLIIRLSVLLRRAGMEDFTIHMLIQILTPFAIYMVAEHFKVSGILAVVAGGIIHAVERDITKVPTMKLQIVSASTWSMILFVLNGLVFILLGLQIPDVAVAIFKNANISNMLGLEYIIILSIMLILLRFAWISLFWKGSDLLKKKKNRRKGGGMWKPIVITSLSGVRGAVTLAAAFSIPLVLQDGSPFPERDLIIFLAAGVILFTLITASLLLPLLSKKDEPLGNQSKERFTKDIKIKILKTVIEELKQEINDQNRQAVSAVIADYNWLLRSIRQEDIPHRPGIRDNRAEMEIRLLALRAERKELQSLLESGKINREAADRSNEVLNHIEALLSNGLKARLAIPLLILKRVATKIFSRHKISAQEEFEAVREVKISTSKAAVSAIKEQMNEENEKIALGVISHYNEVVENLYGNFRKPGAGSEFQRQKKEMGFKAIQIERAEVQKLFESGAITRETAVRLRQFINYTEASMLEMESIVDL